MLNAEFICNICGSGNIFVPAGDWRESPSCKVCGSSVRMRQLVCCLTTAIFGYSRTLPSLDSKEIRGIGLSDPDIFANRMDGAFNYTNTFYHTSPKLDICNPDQKWFGENDFLISSDVFEHVPSPVQRAFDGAFSVLRPRGIFVLTVPFDERPNTTEHFPDVRDFELLKFKSEWLIVGQTDTGRYEVHNDLIFHGGPGTTVEMRFFSRQAIIEHLQAAGFVDIEIHEKPVPEWGIFLPHQQGLPVTARKPAE